MKAILCKELGTADKLVLADIDSPVVGDDEVLVDIKAAALNFPDTLIIQGKYQFRPPMPFVPGGEASGVVAAVGKNVKSTQIGDRVIALTTFGAFAEKLVVNKHLLIPIGEDMDFVTAAGFGITYGTSYLALKQRAGLASGESLLVLGAAGGVGTTAVQLGKALGARVIAAASSKEKLDIARDMGADELIDYSVQDLKQSVKDLTDGAGVNVVYDPVGGDFSEAALRACAWNGRYLVVGFAAGDIPKIPLNLALLKHLNIQGVFWGSWAQKHPRESQENYRELFEMYHAGKIKPLVSQTFALKDYEAAFGALTGRTATGKLVFDMTADT